METVSNFFSTWSPEQLGFAVSTFIFLITVLLVSRRLIGFSVTLLFLVFALIAGFIVSDQGVIRKSLHSTLVPHAESSKTEAIKKELDDKLERVKDHLEKEGSETPATS